MTNNHERKRLSATIGIRRGPNRGIGRALSAAARARHRRRHLARHFRRAGEDRVGDGRRRALHAVVSQRGRPRLRRDLASLRPEAHGRRARALDLDGHRRHVRRPHLLSVQGDRGDRCVDRDPVLFHLSAVDRARGVAVSASNRCAGKARCAPSPLLRPRHHDRRASGGTWRSPASPMRSAPAAAAPPCCSPRALIWSAPMRG